VNARKESSSHPAGSGELQTITVRLSKALLQKARALAARRSISLRALLAVELERLVKSDEDYQRAMVDAIVLMKKGLDLGGEHRLDRDALHDRQGSRI
jgi:hypothetical protein